MMSLLFSGQLQEDVLERGLFGAQLQTAIPAATSERLMAEASAGSAVIVNASSRIAKPARPGILEHTDRLFHRLRANHQAAAAAELVDRSFLTSVPRWMTPTRPHTCSTSGMRWLESKTCAPAAQSLDEDSHLCHALRIESAGRLVQDQHVGILEQRRGHAEALLHTLRVRVEPIIGPVVEPGTSSRTASMRPAPTRACIAITRRLSQAERNG